MRVYARGIFFLGAGWVEGRVGSHVIDAASWPSIRRLREHTRGDSAAPAGPFTRKEAGEAVGIVYLKERDLIFRIARVRKHRRWMSSHAAVFEGAFERLKRVSWRRSTRRAPMQSRLRGPLLTGMGSIRMMEI